MTEHYTFAGNALGLANAWECTVSLRRHGYKTRLATRQITRTTIVQTVVATPPARPTRAERGCFIKGDSNADADSSEQQQTA